jgi:hypothetical protein
MSGAASPADSSPPAAVPAAPATEPTTAPPDPLSVRLSAGVPRLLTGLAHEPTLGLHVICNHVRTAAVPGMVGVRRALDGRAGAMRDSALDASYAADALAQHRAAALPALAAAQNALTRATQRLEQTVASRRK